MKHSYYNSADLVDRLYYAANSKNRRIMFLVGSAISLPDHADGRGVLGVSAMVDLIRSEFAGTDAATKLHARLKNAPANPYQVAFEFLHGRRGQDVVNKIVRSAVLNALDMTNTPHSIFAEDGSPNNYRALENDTHAWVLPSSVDLFGDLLATYHDPFGHVVLTTNFDPLIEISISKHGGRYYRTVLHDDGKLGQTESEGTHIIHLHGYWQGFDTLHTPQQLHHPRPQLKSSLAHVIEESTLVVLGYGGWDDVVTRVLVDLLTDTSSTSEIMWAFHDNEAERIQASNARLLSTLAAGIGRGRVSLYRDIDCRSMLSKLIERLRTSYGDSSENSASSADRAITIKQNEGQTTEHKSVIRSNISVQSFRAADSDSPLIVDSWIGRKQELSLLATSTTPVNFITGLGGQGKSALAGRFLQQYAMPPNPHFEFWDWRDCREQSDRLTTQILRLIERLNDATIDVSKIEVTNIHDVVGILFLVLRDRRALLVFDNVDQYVDLESSSPVKGLDVLVAEAQARAHHSVFLFTCRPDVQIDESRTTRVCLTGLSEDETTALIISRGVPKKDSYLAPELHHATEGHPLWVSLVAMQAIQHPKGLRGALDLIHQGGATLPATTRTIWDKLNEQQRDVLRTMAELDRPEPETRLLDLLPGMNVNRVNRALKTLRSFHLIEMRTQTGGEPLLGLHPIIREFVRTSFPRKDRERYVGPIMGFLDQMIGRFKSLLGEDPSYEILEPWLRKAELQISFGHFEEATSTIADIATPLINRGYSEELIRLARHLFADIDWAEACLSYKDFDDVYSHCIKKMIEYGHYATEDLLKRYEHAISGKSAQYILLCDLKCYSAWSQENFDSAIRWGREGERLKTLTSVDTTYSTRHNLALSLRDAGQISEALKIFLSGEPLAKVVQKDEWIQDKGADFYGNIGRCRFFDDYVDEAHACYVKAARLLEEDLAHDAQLNKGYIRLWIGELLLRKAEATMAAACYRAAECIWERSSPHRAVKAGNSLKRLVAERPTLRHYLDEVDWKVEEKYSRWLVRQ